jgi:hypothetical protein
VLFGSGLLFGNQACLLSGLSKHLRALFSRHKKSLEFYFVLLLLQVNKILLLFSFLASLQFVAKSMNHEKASAMSAWVAGEKPNISNQYLESSIRFYCPFYINRCFSLQQGV